MPIIVDLSEKLVELKRIKRDLESNGRSLKRSFDDFEASFNSTNFSLIKNFREIQRAYASKTANIQRNASNPIFNDKINRLTLAFIQILQEEIVLTIKQAKTIKQQNPSLLVFILIIAIIWGATLWLFWDYALAAIIIHLIIAFILGIALNKTFKEQGKQREKSLLNHYSSRVKDIYIELKDYSFFHRPTGVDNQDRRFIGRVEVMGKLKSIITNSEVDSGAYLITGFRGMGKTSVVNKVLGDLKGKASNFRVFRRYFRLLVIVLFFSFFDVSGSVLFEASVKSLLLNWIPLVLLVIAIRVFDKSDNRKTNIPHQFAKKEQRPDLWYDKIAAFSKNVLKTCHINMRVFEFQKEPSLPSQSIWIIAQDYIVVSLIHFLALWFIRVKIVELDGNEIQFYQKFVAYLASAFLVFIFLDCLDGLKNNGHNQATKEITRKLNRALMGFLTLGLICYFVPILIDKSGATSAAQFSTLKYAFFFAYIIGFVVILGTYLFKNINFRELNFLTFAKLLSFPIFIVLFLVFNTFCSPYFLSILLFLPIIINYQAIFKSIKSFFSYSKIINIKINLGQENLKEVDILRLIAKSVHEKYKDIARPFSSLDRALWRLASLFMFYVVVLVLFYYKPTYDIVNEFRKEYHLNEYFPSQNAFSKGNVDYSLDKEVIKIIETLEKEKEKFADLLKNTYFEGKEGFSIFDYSNLIYAYHETNEAYYEAIIIDYILNHEDIEQFFYSQIDTILFKKVKIDQKGIVDSTEIKDWSSKLLLEEEDLLSPRDSVESEKLKRQNSIKREDLIRKLALQLSEIFSKNPFTSRSRILKNNKSFILIKDTIQTIKESQFLDSMLIVDKIVNQQISTKYDTTLKKFSTVLKDTFFVKKDTSLVFKNIKTDTSIVVVDTIGEGYLKAFHRFDYYAFTLFSDISHFLYDARPSSIDASDKETSFLNSTLDLDENFHLFPPRLDYLFIVFLILTWLLWHLILRLRIFGVRHRNVLRELENLVDSIDASITKELGAKTMLGKIGLSLSNRKIYPIANAREIENRLIQILSMSEKIPFYRMRPKFIFIFDELDKIEPTGNYATSDDNASVLEYVTEGTKKRQEAIGKILSNLKHFFNTAKAKFIFIAGREMYDAALADISDRDSLIGSLFHDVIYVPSFYKDPYDDQLSDITSMTEHFVCQFLLPIGETEFTLKRYRQYVEEKYDFEPKELVKLIVTLQNFITYLTYRSNGAPKKITKVFEEFLIPLKKHKTDDYQEYTKGLFVGDNHHNLYLHFGFYQQYVFGFSSYLFNPFLFAVNKYLKDFGDKLLVSTAFLLNHIYKFHGTGFSYRTLELTPEIIAINKAPELRSFIDRLLNFLSKIHIREISTGLHQFKFHSKIEKEISFISRISEKESAAYNFTLDESLEIKKTYQKRLENARKIHKNYQDNNGLHIDTVSYLNHILGDLYYYDQEFDRALIYYKDATLMMRKMENSKFTLDTIVFYVRNELKLGMTFEKKRNYDDALMIYENLKDRIQYFVMILKKEQKKTENQEEKEIQEETKNQEVTESDTIPKPKDKPVESVWDYQVLPALRLLYQPFIAELQLIEKHSIKSVTKYYVRANVGQFKELVDVLEPEQNFLIKGEHYDKIGDILYYKNSINFGNPKQHIIIDDKKLSLKTDYQQFIDIQDTLTSEGEVRNHLLSLPVVGYKYYMRSLSVVLLVGVNEVFTPNDFDNSLFSMTNPVLSEKLALQLVTQLFLLSTNKTFPNTRQTIYTTLGNSLSDAGDCILCFVKHDGKDNIIKSENLSRLLTLRMDGSETPQTYKEEFIQIENLKQIFTEKIKEEHAKNKIGRYHKTNKEKDEIWKKIEQLLNTNTKFTAAYEDFSRIEIAIRFMYISAICFLKADEFKEFAFQITKIIHVIKFNLGNVEVDGILLKYFTGKIEEDENELQRKIDEIDKKIERQTSFFPSRKKDKKFKLVRLDILKAKKSRLASQYAHFHEQVAELINDIKERLVNRAIRNTYRAYENNEHAELSKLKGIFEFEQARQDENEKHNLEALLLTSTSASEDVVEALVVYKEIELALGLNRKNLKIGKSFVHPYLGINFKFNRILELKYQTHFNYEIFVDIVAKTNPAHPNDFAWARKFIREERVEQILEKLLENEQNVQKYGQGQSHKEIIAYLITDSLFCFHELIKSLNIYGISYIYNHSLLASSYMKMGEWFELYNAFLEKFKDTTANEERTLIIDIKHNLENLIGVVDAKDSNPVSLYESALQHYYLVQQMHSEGGAYREVLEKMYYLDDNFNDNLYHFCAALERFQINNGAIFNNINRLNDRIDVMKNYGADKYFKK